MNPLFAADTVEGDSAWFLLGVLVGFILLAGWVVVLGRRWLARVPRKSKRSQAGEVEGTLMRSWIAISLVGGLLIFAAVSFWLDDETLRSTLIGGVVANAGAAVAFYFASKEADQARQDILNASLGGASVPDLYGKVVADARQSAESAGLLLFTSPIDPRPAAQVISQQPKANQRAAAGSAIVAAFAGPVPKVEGLTLDTARDELKAVDLELVAPASAQGGATITKQDPPEGAPPPEDRKVTVEV